LEATLAEAKQQLQQRKEEVRVMVEEMEKTGRELARSEYLAPLVLKVEVMLIENKDIKMSKLKRLNYRNYHKKSHNWSRQLLP
jgi:hypothetical protein